jgi:monoamine oxidase
VDEPIEQRPVTRRRFLEMVGVAGGSAAVYETMVALGLLNVPAASAQPLKIAAGLGKGKRVLILGAGIAGLTAAYELERAGYEVQVFEASNRSGGRNRTVRRGDVIEQIGMPNQTCQFDSGLYLNAGPGRIPYHHRELIRYCEQLGVALEIYVMETRANLFQTPKSFGGAAQVNRQVANDTRGYIAELLAKSVRKGALDDTLTRADQEKLLSLLTTFGPLDGKELRYTGSSRDGYTVQPGVVTPGEIVPPLALQSLLDAEFWKHRFYQPEEYEWQTTLFHPIGGMDKVVDGFLRAIKSPILLNQQVVRVVNSSAGVTVVLRDRLTGKESTATGDFCLSNLPLPLLARVIDTGSFEPAYASAVGAVSFANTCKVGWQANERFWEKKDWMYGGISFIDHEITQMWYPSDAYFTPKGVLTGAYNFDANAIAMGDLPLPKRLDKALEGARRLHPRFDDYVPRDLGLSIAWQKVPFQEGGWADWDSSDPVQADAYERLLRPDRGFHVIGDQMSYLPGWQEGAILSAHHSIRQMIGEKFALPKILRAPHARRSVGSEF